MSQNHPYRQRVPLSSLSSNGSSPPVSQYQSPQLNTPIKMAPSVASAEASYASATPPTPAHVPTQAASASGMPYPVDDHNVDDVDNASSDDILSHMNQLRLNDPNAASPQDPPHVVPLSASPEPMMPQSSSPRQQTPPHNGSQTHLKLAPGASKSLGHPYYPPHLQGSPYQSGISGTPPAIFSNPAASPPTNSLSATSSITNLNLQSRSENNLSTAKYNAHNRSVSSTSSFLDRTDNMSMVDFNQNIITQYLGDNSNHLMPRIKTIELYRQNAKKSTDPTVLFQYAQYMLQTALLLDKSDNSNAGSNHSSVENSPMKSQESFTRKHTKNKSSNSFDLSDFDENSVDDKKLKRSLLREALTYLKKLSDKGYTEAQYLLGDGYSSGAFGKVENKESFLLFQSAAKHGHVESAYRTSYCYEEGLGTGRDARKAVEYLKMAASKNHPAAMYKLGVYSFYGRMGISPTDVNMKKMGIKWLTRASNVANELIAAAPYELGKIYFNGFKDIVIQDKKYALELYSQAAALGHIESSAILGHFYEIGEIVPQDSNLSIHYYTQAALGGDPNSMLAMCAWYLVGNEPYLPKDENESFEWAKRAAICNLAKGQFALANFYDKGIGCEKSPNEAQHWYIKAAENGDEKSISRINNKELAAKLQKKSKKKRVTATPPTATVANNLNFDSSNGSRDKDCIIV